MTRIRRRTRATRASALALSAALAAFAVASVVHVHGLGIAPHAGRAAHAAFDAGTPTPLGPCVACQAAHVQVQMPDAPAVAPAIEPALPARAAAAEAPRSALRRHAACRAPPASSFPSA